MNVAGLIAKVPLKVLVIAFAGLLVLAVVGGSLLALTLGKPESDELNLAAVSGFEGYLDFGIKAAQMGREDAAMKSLHLAVRVTSNAEERALAAQKMGQVLASRARITPEPYSAMAKSYFLAAMSAVTATSQVYRDSARLLFDMSAAGGDLELFDKMARERVKLTDNVREQDDVFAVWLATTYQQSTYQHTREVLTEIQEAISNRTSEIKGDAWDKTLRLRLIEDKVWFKEYATMNADDNPETLYRSLASSLIAELKADSATNSVTRSGNDLSLALIHYHIQAYKESWNYLQRFMLSKPTARLDEALLLNSALARERGDVDSALESMQSYLQRYSYNKRAGQEVMDVTHMLEKAGDFERAYDLIKRIMQLVEVAKLPLEVLRQAVQYAGALKLNDAAWDYYQILIESYPDEALRQEIILAETDAGLARMDIKGARRWLAAGIPFGKDEKFRSEMLLREYAINKVDGGPFVQAAFAGLVASRHDPVDPRSVKTLLDVANRLEDEGLYFAALDYYNRLEYFGYVAHVSDLRDGKDDLKMLATLGKARASLKAGQLVKANTLFRDLCKTRSATALQSEAAYWWATMAVDGGQGREAVRRLDLVNPELLSPVLQERVRIEECLASVSTGGAWRTSVDGVFAVVDKLSGPSQKSVMQRACRVLYRYFERTRNIDALEYLVNCESERAKIDGGLYREHFSGLAVALVRAGREESLLDVVGAASATNVSDQSLDSAAETVLRALRRQLREVRPEMNRYL